MPDEPQPRFLYIFLDEAGNLDFSKNGSKYFVLGGITKERPFHAYKELTEFKYNQVERGTALEYFIPKVLGTLLREILQHYPLAEFAEVIVFTDSLPVQRKRGAVEKGVKM